MNSLALAPTPPPTRSNIPTTIKITSVSSDRDQLSTTTVIIGVKDRALSPLVNNKRGRDRDQVPFQEEILDKRARLSRGVSFGLALANTMSSTHLLKLSAILSCCISQTS